MSLREKEKQRKQMGLASLGDWLDLDLLLRRQVFEEAQREEGRKRI